MRPLYFFQGLSNGVENDQNSANLQPQEAPHKRLSTSSTTSNQSYDSNVDYAVPKHSYNRNTHRASDATDPTETTQYAQPKITNPLFGVNAASHYAPGAVPPPHTEAVNDTKHFDRNLPNGVRKAPEGQDNDAYKTEDSIDGRKEVLASVGNQISIAEGGTATYTTDNNGKINVHVTVMINAGNYMHPYELLAHYNLAQFYNNFCKVILTVLHSDGFNLNVLEVGTVCRFPESLSRMHIEASSLCGSGLVPRRKYATSGRKQR